MLFRYNEALWTGKWKYDYGNGLVKITLSGDSYWDDGGTAPDKFRKVKGGYRLLGKRLQINNGVQQIGHIWFGNEKTQRETYNNIIELLGDQNTKNIYYGGKPCSYFEDKNTQEFRDQFDSTFCSV